MENLWDTVLEQLSSQLPPYSALNDLESSVACNAHILNVGEHGWLDEKMDLSIWAEYILPDDPLAMVGDSPLLLDPLEAQAVDSLHRKLDEPSVLDSDFSQVPPSSPPFSMVPEISSAFDKFPTHALDSNVLGDGQLDVLNSLLIEDEYQVSSVESPEGQLDVLPYLDAEALYQPIENPVLDHNSQPAPVTSSPVLIQQETQIAPQSPDLNEDVAVMDSDISVPVDQVIVATFTLEDAPSPTAVVPQADLSSDYTTSGSTSGSDNEDQVAEYSSRKNKGYRPRAKRVAEGNRRERKRLQNKDAATRYRIKKRMENIKISDEEMKLTTENKELKSQVDRLSNEISYLKSLMRELFKAKGLLK